MQAVTRTARGIFTQYNPLHETPEGAVKRARNCALYQEGIYSPRRGFNRYGDQFQPSSLMEFDNRLIGLAGSTLKYDSDGNGTWTAWDGTWSPPESTIKMRGVQVRTALYLLASDGVYYTEDLTTTPIQAGLATGLDIQTTKTGIGASWFTPGTQVGYRVVWGRLTPYGTLQLGAPSMRKTEVNSWATGLAWTAAGATVTVTQTSHGYATGDTVVATNLSDADATPTGTITVTGANTYTYVASGTPAASGTGDFGKAIDIQITFTCPDDLQGGDFYEIYRTAVSASATTDPRDEQKRVLRSIVPDAAVDAQAVTMTGSGTTVTVSLTAHSFAAGDVILMSGVSDAGYENGAHEITSVATDTFTYEVASAPASGTGSCKLLTITLIDTLDSAFLGENLYTNPTRETITQANTRPPWAKDACQWKNHVWYANTKRAHYVDFQLISVANLVAGTSSVSIKLGATTETYTFAAATDYQDKEFLLDSTSSTTAEKIRNTMLNFCSMVNRTSTLFYAWYISGIDDAPGIVTVEARVLNTASFTVTCNNATTGAEFEPELPTSGTDFVSDNFRLLNSVYWSKRDQPHAVPDENFEESLGDPSKEVLRLIPTRDSILVIKEDGVFRISGDSERTWTFKPLDLTVFGRAPETWVGLDNAVWGLSTKGVLRITESGTQLMSKPNDPEIDDLLQHGTFETLCHAVGYESEGLYILFAPEDVYSTVCDLAWVYPTDGFRGPTTWHRSSQAAIVLFGEQKIYFSSADSDDHIFSERKSLTESNHLDEELECTVTEVTTYTDAKLGTLTRAKVTFPITATLNTDAVPVQGFLFRQTPTSLPYSKVRIVEEVDVDTYYLYLSHHLTGLTTGTAYLFRNIPCVLEWHPEGGEVATVLKRFSFLQFYFDAANVTRVKVRFLSDVQTAETEVEQVQEAVPDRIYRVAVPLDHAMGRTLGITFEHQVGSEEWKLTERSLEFKPIAPSTSVLPTP